ncbi:MAG: hypothetical protein Q8M73_00375 [Actinomycetota bacterium]|nr:hypothetical protein [Actinomycetota bacterium]
MRNLTEPAPSEGIAFPVGGDGRVSSLATGRAILADSVRGIDPLLAARIEHTDDWRHGYLTPVRDSVLAAAQHPLAAAQMAADGLASAYRRFQFSRAGELGTLDSALATQGRLGTATIRGRSAGETGFSVPYRGQRLFDGDLRKQLDQWVQAGIAEPEFAASLNLLLDNPDWLDLSDLEIAVLGAGAEMAPTRSLLRWGATVHAIDLPQAATWTRLIAIARATSGTLHIPMAPPEDDHSVVHPDEDHVIAGIAGIDLLVDTPEIARWLARGDGRLTVGSYAYADGAKHVRLSVAVDVIVESLRRSGRPLQLAYLASPTDVNLVPIAAVEESQRRWRARGVTTVLQLPMRMARKFEPNYSATTAQVDALHGLNDSIIEQQGPNYILAKHLQRWRALVAHSEGSAVSMNIAPMTRTQSVIKSRALKAGYSGAARFGIEVFEPATSTALMAGLLVHDLRNPLSKAQPTTPLQNPLELISSNAIHSGLWRTAYAPRSVLTFAAMLGLFESRQ